jgi:hypothetical protein
VPAVKAPALKLDPLPNAVPPLATLNQLKVPPDPNPFKITELPAQTAAAEAAGAVGNELTVAVTCVSVLWQPDAVSRT